MKLEVKNTDTLSAQKKVVLMKHKDHQKDDWGCNMDGCSLEKLPFHINKV